jgi:outer membrane protein OmpA-like peptidoglycan-associated protein
MKTIKIIGIIALGGALSACQHYAKDYSVYFNNGSSSITQTEKTALTKVADKYLMQAHTGTPQNMADMKKLHIISYTDAVGSKTANMKLSEKRANIVKKVLVKAGVKTSDIEILARGECKGKSKTSNPKARRVDVSIF